QTVDKNLAQRSRILMRHNACCCPGSCGVLGGKRCTPAMEKWSTAITLKRPLAPERIFHPFHNKETVCNGFSRQKTSLAPMRIVFGVTQQPHCPGSAKKSTDSRIRQGVVVTQGRWIVRDMAAHVGISDEQPCCNPAHRYQPVRVGPIQMSRAGPDFLLVQQEPLAK